MEQRELERREKKVLLEQKRKEKEKEMEVN
jgi:hypothetical protein